MLPANSTSNRLLGAVLLTLLLGAPALARGAPAEAKKADSPGVAFEVVDGAHRELDGSPALALSFSLPLDSRKDYGKFAQVLEMPPKADAPAENAEEENEGEAPGEAAVSRAPDTPLDGGKPVSGAWVVGENPRLLFFPHVKPQTRYVVRILAGLPGKGGVKLAAEERFLIRTAAVSPAYYFASRGMVLPAAQNGGLPVTTVNVPEVDIQFLRVRPDQLPKFLERVIAGKPTPPRPAKVAAAEGDDEETEQASEEAEEEAYYYGARQDLRGSVTGWTLDEFHSMTESVFAGRFPTEKKANRRSVTFIPVETIPALREPGVYIAVMSQPNRFRYEYQTTYFYVSDLGLHLRQYAGKGADAFVTSLVNAQAVPGAEIEWLGADGRALARARTDTEGRANFAEWPREARVVTARRGRQLSLIALKEPALDLAEFDVGGLSSSATRLFAYSGRNLYRPGERFDVSVLARDADGMPVPAQPIQALLRRPDGKAQWTAMWAPQEKFAGYYRQTVELPADAATGFWNLELRADPADKRPATAMRLSVEEFLPERMKLDLSTDAERLDAVPGGGVWNIGVAGAYLSGAPAAGNKLLGVVNAEPQRNPLAQTLPGFVFGDADEEKVHSRVELDEMTLDDEGKSAVAVDLVPVQGRHSPFTVRATLSLLESGGRPVVRSIERVWWPAAALVGLRPMFNGAYARQGAPVEFEIVRADASGKLSGNRVLPLRLFRENRHYYWRFDDQRGWHSGYTETDELAQTAQVTIPAAGRGKFSVPVQYGRYRVEVLDPETGLTARFRFYAGWYAREDETQGVRPDRVAMKLDKPAYADGETVRLTLTPPHAGEALVTVEGDRLLWLKRLSVGAGPTTIDIPLDKAWKRHDLYVTAMVLRPGGTASRSGAGATPARALGLVYLPLDRAARKLGVALEAPKKMEPERALKVKVKVKPETSPPAASPAVAAKSGGKAGKGKIGKNAKAAAPEKAAPAASPGVRTAMVTLSAVDVGILNITNYASPDPFGFFFGKLRYGQDLYDIYGRLIEKMAGRKGKLKWGGDATAQASRNLPQKVRLVDLFSGPVTLDENGEAEISLPVPDFNGALRLMAVASSDESFGMAETEVVVGAPLIVELATPRFLSAGDSARLSLDVQNMAGEDQDVKITVANSGGLVIRDGEHGFPLKDKQKRVLVIPIEAGTANGLTEIEVAIRSQRVDLKRRFALQVQPPTPRQTILRRYAIAPGETLNIQDAGLSGLLPATVAASLSVSDRTPIDIKNAVRGLLMYPYGCAEQTTSSAYPHVFVDEDDARRFGLKPFTLAQRASMLDKAMSKLAGMQGVSGGFSLWGGSVSEYQYWLSAYVANFLLDARENGFNPPAEMEKKALDFLLRGLQEGVAGLPAGEVVYDRDSVWRDPRYAGAGRFGVLAYGAYVLARQGKAPLSTLRQMFEARSRAYSGLSLVHLGIALKLMGDDARAQEAIAAGIPRGRIAGNQWWGDYGSDLRDAAMIYVLLERHGINPAGRDNLVMQVAGQLEGKQYLSTQEKLAVFLLGRGFARQPTGQWSARLSNRDAALEGRGTLFAELTANELATGVTLKNTHTQRLFAELNVSGNPAAAPPARREFFDIQRAWYDAKGQPIGNRPLYVGESLIVHVRVKPGGYHANALAVDYVPAGVEIENANLVQGEGNNLEIDGIDMNQALLDTRVKHREFRDDRFVAAFRANGSPIDLFYRVRVVTPGHFVMPPSYAEDMYQPMAYGLSGGGETVTVVDKR
ncbi:MAG: alpha-2-macroglobulin family protein [Candidatus Accumulibacter sp.]|jgi:uncharacterized protein YfaS (alpha-2-macroglobulin family)|nr:alpha-2-macroglobulin family protein [Accumulibacter sp.]